MSIKHKLDEILNEAAGNRPADQAGGDAAAHEYSISRRALCRSAAAHAMVAVPVAARGVTGSSAGSASGYWRRGR